MEEKDTIIFSDLIETIDFKALPVLDDIFDGFYPIWYLKKAYHHKYVIDLDGSWITVEFCGEKVIISSKLCDTCEIVKYPIKKSEFYEKLLHFRVFAELRI